MKRLVVVLCVLSLCVDGCSKKTVMSLPVLSTATISNVTANSVQAGGAITNNGGSSITQSGVCYALHTNPSLSDSIVPSGVNNTGNFSFTVTIKNLNANTKYYVRAYATNGQGTAYGNVDSVTTSPGLAAITTAAITNNQALSANSGWTLNNNGGTAITAVGICWSTSPMPTISNAKTSDGVNLTTAVDTLTNLTLTTYYVRAYATNSAGTAYGNQVSFVVSTTGTVVDIDGNAYPTVTIGNQTWMGANLRVRHYNNGDSIVDGFLAPGYNWSTPPGGAYTFVNGDSTNRTTYGLLYNVPAVNDARSIAPTGWHVATDHDWNVLEVTEGMSVSDTATVGLVGTIAPKLVVGGSSGLNLQFSGEFALGQFARFGTEGYFFTSSFANTTANWARYFYPPGNANAAAINRNYSGFVLSVRCVKNP